MCKVVSNCLADATRAVRDGDAILAAQVIASGELLGAIRTGAESQALELLSLQAPVASELRAVVGSLWIVADLQRMGSLAVLVAQTCLDRYPRSVVPQAVRPIVDEMADLAVQLADQAGRVLRDRDVKLAVVVEAGDDRIDDLQREVFSKLLGRNWAEGVQAAVDVALLCRYLERFADHAVAVARRVVFVVTGDPVQSRVTPSRVAKSRVDDPQVVRHRLDYRSHSLTER